MSQSIQLIQLYLSKKTDRAAQPIHCFFFSCYYGLYVYKTGLPKIECASERPNQSCCVCLCVEHLLVRLSAELRVRQQPLVWSDERTPLAHSFPRTVSAARVQLSLPTSVSHAHARTRPDGSEETALHVNIKKHTQLGRNTSHTKAQRAALAILHFPSLCKKYQTYTEQESYDVEWEDTAEDELYTHCTSPHVGLTIMFHAVCLQW